MPARAVRRRGGVHRQPNLIGKKGEGKYRISQIPHHRAVDKTVGTTPRHGGGERVTNVGGSAGGGAKSARTRIETLMA